jgi:hypothetical protein
MSAGRWSQADEHAPRRGDGVALPARPARGVTRLWMLLVGLVGFVSASGASCHQLAEQYTGTGHVPRALPAAPTLEDVVRVVNDNSSRVQSLYTTDASISSGLLPSISANIALDRPRRFRLRAETGLTGPEVDLGSNDELFWFWVRRNQPPAIFYCRHDQFATSPARQIIPVEPHWLIEALGLAWFDPNEQHAGPAAVGAGRLSIRTTRQTLLGPVTKVTTVDDSRGWVLEQHLYDQRNQLIASALTSRHQHDPATNVTLPREIEIRWPATQLTMQIYIKSWRINTLDANAGSLWTMPEFPGWNPVDLGNPNVMPPRAALR